MRFLFNKQVKNECHKTFWNHFSPPFCCCGYSMCLDSLLFPWWHHVSSPCSSSVIQTPSPLPVDKVRAEMCVVVFCPACKLFVSVPDLDVCSSVATFVCLCVLGSFYTHKWLWNTHRHAHTEWSSQLIEECMDSCHFLTPEILCGSRRQSFCPLCL